MWAFRVIPPLRRGDVYDLGADLSKNGPLVYSRIGNDIEQIAFFGPSADQLAKIAASSSEFFRPRDAAAGGPRVADRAGNEFSGGEPAGGGSWNQRRVNR